MRACTYRDTHTQIQVKWKLSIRLVGYLNVSILAVVLYYKFATIAPTSLVTMQDGTTLETITVVSYKGNHILICPSNCISKYFHKINENISLRKDVNTNFCINYIINKK